MKVTVWISTWKPRWCNVFTLIVCRHLFYRLHNGRLREGPRTSQQVVMARGHRPSFPCNTWRGSSPPPSAAEPQCCPEQTSASPSRHPGMFGIPDGKGETWRFLSYSFCLGGSEKQPGLFWKARSCHTWSIWIWKAPKRQKGREQLTKSEGWCRCLT